MFSIFSHSVQQEADSIAIILSNKEKLSYAKVNELVELWAKYFIFVGVQQGNRVAVLTKNEDLHPLLHLALDKINATVVPLDTDTPSAQLATDIRKLNLNKIVIDEKLCQDYEIPEPIRLHLYTQGIAPKNSDELTPVCLPPIERNPTLPNYIVASSGVSDNKKWIPINSSGLTYWAEVEKSLLKLSNKDKILCTRSPAYDARISEYVRSFAAASTLVLMPQAARRDFNAVIEQCEQEKITCLILIASQLAMPNQDELIQRLAKTGLTHLMVTGDACSMSLKRLCEKYGINLWNCYGPTEATFGMSILCVNQEEIQDENGHHIVPIGFPHGEEVKFHLIDECLYIESPFLSPGYIDNPELTQKNFPTLFLDHRWVRVFNTENKFLVKDNRLIFKGRIDNDAHIKISGVKVAPYAIQQCIEKYNDEIGQDVLQVYVVVKPWLNNNKPFAYLVVQHEFSKPHFMAYLKKWLRKEELPIIVTLSDFPRLIPSEKIDRRALIARTDHPDELFFNEGKQNKEKFSAGGLGLEPSVLREMDEFVEKIKNNQVEFITPEIFFMQMDRLVLAANHLDQTLNLNASNKEKVLQWLDAAYQLVTKYFPQYLELLDENAKRTIVESAAITHLASVAQLLHYYGKALRYGETNEKRIKFLKAAVTIASYLEERSELEDPHAFRGRLLTYNLALMLCLRDGGDVKGALELANQQVAFAIEKQEIFHIVQYKSYIAGMLLSFKQPEEALQCSSEALALSRQFYRYQVVFCNAAIAYIKCCIQNKEENKACELAREILAAYKSNPLCGVKAHHLQEARETLQRYDQLAHSWCNVLGLTESDEDQEFIFLGGDSTQLSQLVFQIQQRIDPTFSYQKILNLPSLTLKHIRESLHNKQQIKQTSAIVRSLFSPTSDRANYFFLPPLLGEGYFTYKELAQIFSSHYQFNIYGLSDPSIYDPTLLPKTLEEAASRYVEAIKTVQPQGPYNLLGFSYGGTLAYYVAKQLLAQGDRIKALHLVDGFPPQMYQKLSAKDHAELLEELVNFVIQTLNNRFYDEKLKRIKLSNFDKLSPVNQINKSFNELIIKVKKQESKALLMLARQHLLLMLETKEINKLPVWANLYLSTPNQTYLDVINRIHKIVKKSAHCQSYFWNHYFEEVNLAGKRVGVQHLQLLKPQKTNFGNSAHIFWERAHDPLFNLPYDYFGPKPFFYLEKVDEISSICHLYSLDWRQLAFFKQQLAQTPQVTNLHAYPIYDRIAEKYERKDRIYVTKYCLSFRIPKEEIAKLQDFFREKQISHFHLKGDRKLSLPYIEGQQPDELFCINLDIHWNGQYLMSLYFNCHGKSQIVLEKIFAVMKMNIDRFSERNNNLYNYSHYTYDIDDPSIFNAVEHISSWLNCFITLLLPHVEPPIENKHLQMMNA
ncbi:non-ribosomal peptide synthetase [Legionella brunensis]|uniref:Peptide synthetase, non-ribosomal n=1 Tax=Legionella brunensis TaxID=29422 RepID=A0A0W0SUW8_9GAMM|nr:alpha/beta fold hydrolase [Legionella brunensis]KTC86989.1 peptide synthetase, non-ribosomal [Legionella brunensis]